MQETDNIPWRLRLAWIPAIALLAAACGSEAPGTDAEAAGPAPDFTGIWSGVFTTQDDEFWPLEDYACFVGCPPEAYAMYGRLIDDPANDDRPLEELQAEMFAFMRNYFTERFTPEGRARQEAMTPENDTVFQCSPYGYVRAVTNPLPMEIRAEDGNLVFDYEEWNQTRTIYMDGREHPRELEPSHLGHSIGHYEGDTLVIETTGVKADRLYSFVSGGGYSDSMHGVERYTLRDGGQVLDLEFTYEDPVILREPIVIAKTWIATPGLELLEDSCEDVAGQP